ncbi:MAG: hypothetical protein KDA31_11020 [Phycisphaerales bacterium]|nr:hypothetical protein [Phycisphaerales bacterium]MCB9835294.1 hypothetical protein [Phycisphaera sp.]
MKNVFLGCAAAALGAIALPATAQTAAIVAASTNTANAQTEPRFTDPRDKIMATGLFTQVDIINATGIGDGTGTPSLATLMQYDAVIVWSNASFVDSVEMGDVLADYVDAGGGVVVALFANTTTSVNRNLAGRWQDAMGGYIAIPQGGGFTTNTTVSIGEVPDPNHPIMNGVEIFVNDVGIGTNGPFGAWRPTNPTLTAGSTLVARYTDGKTLIAVAPNPRVVELGFHPVSSAVNDGYWNETTDGGLIMANALLFAAGLTGGECLPDVNGDGMVTPADFSAWVAAFNSNAPECDQNQDGMCTPADFSAWVANYNAGC